MSEEWFHAPKETRQEMADDPHRPAYHFLPPRNWMNDPNGLFYWHGRYHLFYQFNPYRPVWGFIHWGHASSPDLIRWEDHPIALQPTEGAGDANGCWSGCMVNDHGTPTVLYTGFVDPANTPVMLARAQDPDLLILEKIARNPVIQKQPEEVNETDFRDPYVWREGDLWKMVIGAGLKNGNGAVLLYQSENLLDWDYLGPLFTARTLDSVQMWECPNFFPLGDQYVLLVSLFPGILGVYYYVGEYDGQSFTPNAEGFLTTSPFFYAPQVRRLKDERTIMFGWLLEGREDNALEEAGWAGVQSLPRELSLDETGHLMSRPIDEVKTLRKEPHSLSGLVLEQGSKHEIPVAGRHLALALTLETPNSGLEIDLLASPDRMEKVSVRLAPGGNRLEMDLRASNRVDDLQKPCLAVDLPEHTRDFRTLQIYIDGSVIEAWVDDRIALTGRAYPTAEKATGLYLSSIEGLAKIQNLQVWKMEAIWPTAGEM